MITSIEDLSLVLVALVALPAYFTGEPAEEALEGLPGVSEGLIERHEDAAAVATGMTVGLGALALVGSALHCRRAFPRGCSSRC